jgi:mannose-1-phosphate guanylyltransferase/mannose-6-phosphate isomerase
MIRVVPASSSVLIPVVLCGGAGSRLWPVSRELHPKPFLQLHGGRSLLQETYLRALGLPDVGEVVTVTGSELFFKAADEYRSLPESAGHRSCFLLEPVARNTAAAIASATLQVQKDHGDEAILLVLPADHVVTQTAAFQRAVGEAVLLAARGRLVTFGIRPDHAATGYGYIEHSGSEVLRFVEKPGQATAEEYVATGRFLWNSGMFCFQARTMLRELDRWCPDLLAAVDQCMRESAESQLAGARQIELARARFESVPENSIDYAVMEKTDIASVVACDLGWTDVGSWTALGGLSAADGQGNRVQGEVRLYDVHNCYVHASGRMVGVVGVDDLVIVDTADALLVAHKDRSQDVRRVYMGLKSEGHSTYKTHPTVHRPWGTYTVLEEASNFKVKRISVRPGASLSLQLHRHRSEHWVVVTGVAGVVKGEQSFLLQANQSCTIAAGEKHRLHNPGVVDLQMIEIQSGEYLGEDDIVRFEDKYGRA